MTRCSYGAPRVRKELPRPRDPLLNEPGRTAHADAQPWLSDAGMSAVGIHYRKKRWRGYTRANGSPVSDDLVNPAFDPPADNRRRVMDVTEHPTNAGKIYCTVVIDASSRRVVGWSIADHIRAQPVADELPMAICRRGPTEGQLIAHSDH